MARPETSISTPIAESDARCRTSTSSMRGCATGGAAFPAGKLAATSSIPDIGFRRITPHHSLAVEHGADLADGLLHHPYPARAIRVIERQDDVFELAIEVGGMSSRVRVIFVAADRPSGHAFLPALDPPAVEHAQIQH